MKKVLFILVFICTSAAVYAQESSDFLIPFVEKRGDFEFFGYETIDRKEIIKAKYRIAETDKFYKMAIVLRDDGQWVGIDRNEKVILYPFIYDNGPDYVCEGLFRFVENEKIGFADLNGNIFIKSEFDFAEPFKEGLAEYAYGGHKEFDHGDEHWVWTGASETGYINKYGQRFIRILKTEDSKRIAITKEGRRFDINDDGRIVKEITRNDYNEDLKKQ